MTAKAPGSVIVRESDQHSKVSTSHKSPKKKGNATCLVCEKAIIGKNKGQDAVFCEGAACQDWIHRTCAGLTKSQYNIISSPSHKSPFYCLQCIHVEYTAQITRLQATVAALSEKVANLESGSTSGSQLLNDKFPSFAEVLKSNVGSHGASVEHSVSNEHFSHSGPKMVDSKFNVVLYGIEESPDGTPRHHRLTNDINKVYNEIKVLDDTIPNQSIRDCIRLGKYTKAK